MELNDEERYALASLFTLALHASQYDGGNTTEEAWGEPPAVERDPQLVEELSEAELESWWGYDLVAHGGLLDRIFRELQLPPTKWKGLKLLPTAAPSAGSEEFRQMVRGLIAMLDAELAAALPALLPRRDSRGGGAQQQQAGGGGGAGGESPASPPSSGGRRAVRDDLFLGLINSDSEDDSDEDWAADLEREQKLQASAERHRSGQGRQQLSEEMESVVRLTKQLSGGMMLNTSLDEQHLQQQQEQQVAWHPLQQGGEQQGDEQQGDAPASPRQQQEAAAPAAGGGEQTPPPMQLQRWPTASAGPVSATPKAIGAVWELVQCCVGAVPLPPDPSAPRLPRPVGVRWYDARARAALFQVASWLQMPPRKVANLELLLTQDKAPRHKALNDLEEDTWERRMRYFKVGAAAVGGGALFAVTGGLAAPAIAAGMGSILGFIGAPSAIAGTVTGFLASTAGAATVTTTMAASGAASTGSRMAYRVAEISEFGFRELLPREPAVGAAGTPAQPPGRGQQGSQPPSRQQSAALPSSQPPSRQQSAHLLPPAASADLQRQQSSAGAGKGGGEAGSDPGHLHLVASAGGAGGYHSARAQALRRPGSASSLGSAASGGADSGSSSGMPWGSGGGGVLAQAAAAAEAQQAAQQAEQQPSVWQRWFGSTSKKDEYLLLPVPMRSKQSGDVKLAVSIYVPGWISKREDYETTWQDCITPGDSDAFALVWESKVLLHLSSQLGRLLTLQAAGQGLQLATHSFFYAGAGLVAALGPTVLLGSASGLIISNAWAVASDRAVKAGKLLAHLLLSGAHGDRPVKLVSHGMGARLVFHCLLELCRQGARGVVQHAVLMGCPVGTEGVRWRMARRAVAGRLINCYSRKDWMLGVCAGGSSGWMKATAGLVPIEDVPGVENVNLSNLIDGHFGYLEHLEPIMDMLML
ncbi:hypothetical protein ABPG75_003779 [Micractinium tetrahymenae]